MVYNRLIAAFENCGAKLQLLFISLYKLREIFSPKVVKWSTMTRKSNDSKSSRAHTSLNIF